MVRNFDNNQLCSFLNTIGIRTYIGSTGKIFPEKGIKPIEVLNAWLKWLRDKGAVFHFRHYMKDIRDKAVLLENKTGEFWYSFDTCVLALGGASWSKTGSDGQWSKILESKGIEVVPFQPANAGMNCDLKIPGGLYEGTVIKNILLRHHLTARKGEITITDYGIEGAPVYYCNRSFREYPEEPVYIDFKPQFDSNTIEQLLSASKNSSEGLRQLKLAKVAIEIIKAGLTKEEYTDLQILSEKIKNFPLSIHSLRPIEEAISTTGGISWKAVHSDLSLKKLPSVYVCGEMLDWDAPTGGYLLQGCFASGFHVGTYLT